MPAEVRAVVIAAWQRGRVLLPPVTVGRMVPAAPDAQFPPSGAQTSPHHV